MIALDSTDQPRRNRESGVAREEIFVETKIWISDYGYDDTLHGFEKSAAKLGLGYIDLLLLHQPLSSRFDLTLDAYRAMEKLLADGKVRAIGVSNFMPDLLTRLLAETTIVPAANQIELHPYFQQKDPRTCTPDTASLPRLGPPSAASPPTVAAKKAH
jgi:diketogulonate reductase-like aldo/keto reductase